LTTDRDLNDAIIAGKARVGIKIPVDSPTACFTSKT